VSSSSAIFDIIRRWQGARGRQVSACKAVALPILCIGSKLNPIDRAPPSVAHAEKHRTTVNGSPSSAEGDTPVQPLHGMPRSVH
jgi:hypothetical protein